MDRRILVYLSSSLLFTFYIFPNRHLSLLQPFIPSRYPPRSSVFSLLISSSPCSCITFHHALFLFFQTSISSPPPPLFLTVAFFPLFKPPALLLVLYYLHLSLLPLLPTCSLSFLKSLSISPISLFLLSVINISLSTSLLSISTLFVSVFSPFFRHLLHLVFQLSNSSSSYSLLRESQSPFFFFFNPLAPLPPLLSFSPLRNVWPVSPRAFLTSSVHKIITSSSRN